jgi:hypothetical protein
VQAKREAWKSAGLRENVGKAVEAEPTEEGWRVGEGGQTAEMFPNL